MREKKKASHKEARKNPVVEKGETGVSGGHVTAGRKGTKGPTGPGWDLGKMRQRAKCGGKISNLGGGPDNVKRQGWSGNRKKRAAVCAVTTSRQKQEAETGAKGGQGQTPWRTINFGRAGQSGPCT